MPTDRIKSIISGGKIILWGMEVKGMETSHYFFENMSLFWFLLTAVIS
jgi:hypothetical protein